MYVCALLPQRHRVSEEFAPPTQQPFKNTLTSCVDSSGEGDRLVSTNILAFRLLFPYHVIFPSIFRSHWH